MAQGRAVARIGIMRAMTEPSNANHQMSDSELVQKLGGRFIVFDGPDGSGKTTQFRRLVELAEANGVTVCEVREPGGTYIGEQVRNVLLDPTIKEEVDIRCEMLLFMASRAQLVAQRIRPAIEAGHLVLADRFISSTLAYQGTAGGIPQEDIVRIGQVALGETWPELTIVFDVDEKTAAGRLNPLLDRMEQKGAAFHRRVREGYLEQVERDPDRYAVIDATQTPEAVFAGVMAALEKHISR